MDVSRADISVKNLRNPKADFYKINANTKFGENP